MAFGDPRSGLLREMIDLINELGPLESYDSDHVTRELQRRGQWEFSFPKTPERTVNSYFSQNTDIFFHVGANIYRLEPSHVR